MSSVINRKIRICQGISKAQVYEKCYHENILDAKNYLLKANDIRFGSSTKGHLINISTAIIPSTFKKIGTKSYWVNNNIEIWNYLTVILGLDIFYQINFY
jgi:hypothetical protein